MLYTLPVAYTRKPTVKLSGQEEFLNSGAYQFSVLDLWRYAFSNLNSNIIRGIVAEFLVEVALHGVEGSGIRNPWEDFDVRTVSGSKVEVKCSAYLQDWDQENLSRIVFSNLKAGSLLAKEAATDKEYKADIYVFALLHHQDSESLNLLDLTQWSFFVVSREHLAIISGNTGAVSLSILQRASINAVSFGDLKAAIEAKDV